MGNKTLSVRLTLNDKDFQSGLRKASSSLKKVGKSFQNVGSSMSRNFTLPLVVAGSAAIKLASDYEESLNKVKVAFGSTSIQVETFAKTTLESFGIAEGSALEMASLFGDMSTSMGLTEQEAAGMSTSLVGLAGDLASFKNIGIEQAQTALAGIFTGETESLKKLGIVMTEANLKSFALTQGMNSNVKSMTQAEKVALRYSFVMAKTANAQGDFSRTSDGFANQTRILQESLKQLGQEMGAVILPLATKIVVKFNSIVKSLRNLTTEQKENIIFWSKLVAVLGPAIFIIGKIVTIGSNVIKTIRALSAAQAVLNAVLIANPIGALITAFALLAAAVTYVATSSSDTAVAVRNVFRKMTNGVIAGINLMIQAFNLLPGVADIPLIELLQLEETQKEIDKTIKSVNKLNSTVSGGGASGDGPARPTLARIAPKKALSVPINLELPDNLGTIKDEIKTTLGSFSEAFYDFSDDFKQSLQDAFSTISQVASQVSGIVSQMYEAQTIKAENAHAKEMEILTRSKDFALMTEEQKAVAIAEVDNKLANKKKEIQKKQARAEKAAAIFQAIVGTASAVAQALPNLPLSILAGVLGAAQIATIASTPVPAFQDGGLVTGATMGLVGEGPGTSMSNPEVIAPLDKLKGLIGGAGGGVEVYGKISGSDILLSSDRARDNRKRTRGY